MLKFNDRSKKIEKVREIMNQFHCCVMFDKWQNYWYFLFKEYVNN